MLLFNDYIWARLNFQFVHKILGSSSLRRNTQFECYWWWIRWIFAMSPNGRMKLKPRLARMMFFWRISVALCLSINISFNFPFCTVGNWLTINMNMYVWQNNRSFWHSLFQWNKHFHICVINTRNFIWLYIYWHNAH